MLLICIISLSLAVQTLEVKDLYHISYSDVAFKDEQRHSKLWYPKASSEFKPDFRPLQLCDSPNFERLKESLHNLINAQRGLRTFEWTGVSLFSLKSTKLSYILLGGSGARRQSSDMSVTPRDGGSVYLCELKARQDGDRFVDFGPSQTNCIQLSERRHSEGIHESLGASVSSIALNDSTALIGYCDPLWRATKQVPVGRCYLRLLINGVLKASNEFNEFCQSGLNVANPCMAGHSLYLSTGLRDQNTLDAQETLSNVQMWVGEPLFLPDGRVQLLSDPLGVPTLLTIDRPSYPSTAMGSYFGYAVTDGYATAPVVAHVIDVHSNDTAQVFGLSASAEGLNSINWMGGVQNSVMFSGYGTSILRINQPKLLKVAVIVGAPYTSVTQNNVTSGSNVGGKVVRNSGRIYLYCHAEAQFRPSMRPDMMDKPSDALNGPPTSTYFGFSLSDMGDVDGDGFDDLAVGSPDLDHIASSGAVYVIRILQNCTFDPTPIQIIKGPPGAYDFGSKLPERAEDLDFNQPKDIVIPTSRPLPIPHTYVSRSKVTAECRFTFPPWLAILSVTTGKSVPIDVDVYLTEADSANHPSKIYKSISDQESESGINHQILADWNATSPASQRFKPTGKVISSYEHPNSIRIRFEIEAQMDVRDMVGVESVENGLYVGYRFLQSCEGKGRVVDENGTCSEGTGARRYLIDWSGCISRVPLTRFVCYPRGSCESDIALHVTDSFSQTTLYYNRSASSDDSIEDAKLELSTRVNLIYGDVKNSHPTLLIKVYNFGPTFADGVRIEFQFLGNLRFSRLDALTFENDNPHASLARPLAATVTENGTWASFEIGHLQAPNADHVPQGYVNLKLSTYYKNFASPSKVNFSLGAGLTINLHSGTPDPIKLGNSLEFIYDVVNSPNIRVSYAPDTNFSPVENRTEESFVLPSRRRRIDVSELGPRIRRSMQVEYLGPTSTLHNVTFRLSVPFELAPKDREPGRESYIVYLFNQVRAHHNHQVNFEWIDVRPRIVMNGMSPSGDNDGEDTKEGIVYCTIEDSGTVVNPRQLIGIDTSNGELWLGLLRHAIIVQSIARLLGQLQFADMTHI